MNGSLFLFRVCFSEWRSENILPIHINSVIQWWISSVCKNTNTVKHINGVPWSVNILICNLADRSYTNRDVISKVDGHWYERHLKFSLADAHSENIVYMLQVRNRGIMHYCPSPCFVMCWGSSSMQNIVHNTCYLRPRRVYNIWRRIGLRGGKWYISSGLRYEDLTPKGVIWVCNWRLW